MAVCLRLSMVMVELKFPLPKTKDVMAVYAEERRVVSYPTVPCFRVSLRYLFLSPS